MEYPEFNKYTYYSNTAERDTNVNVLLPPGYSEEKEYPVLYILHGFWDNEDWMARPVVALNTMLSNLYASGEAKEMIVVLPYIYCSKDMPYCTGMDLTNSPMHPGQMTGAEMVFPEDKAPYVVMISASKADGVVGTNPKTYHNVMTKNGTEHIWHELTDTGHDHTSVKPHLYNFLRLIFKEK